MSKAYEQNFANEEIIFFAERDADKELVSFIEELTGLTAVGNMPADKQDKLTLFADSGGPALVKGNCFMRADFTKELPRLSPNNLNGELIIKAARIKGARENLTAVDATAGLGEDSLLLAAAGFNVIMYEKNPIIAALLYDALKRGENNRELKPIVRRMELRIADSTAQLGKLDFSPDVVLLDPMFPQRKKSGLIKKKFQLLHFLESPCENEKELLNAAMLISPKKIIIKRPAKGAFLADMKPDYSVSGNSIRYDCIVSASKKENYPPNPD